MPVFRPCIGTRAQVDARPVVNGQFLVATDTGEAFIDFNGVRIRISGSSGGSASDEDEDSLLTAFSIVNAAISMSESVSGGGPGSGLLNVPTVLLEIPDDDLTTSYSITEET